MLFETTPLYSGGTGTGDMIRRCQEAALREPKFELADGFTLTLWRARDGDVEAKPSGKTSGKTSGIVSGITSGKMSGKIVRLIADKPDITIPELALRLKRTTRAIEMQINRLKADEIIGRVGPAKGGHWEIFK